MSMPPLSGERQPAGVSTAESECSGSCSSYKLESNSMEPKEVQPETVPSTASTSPLSSPPNSRRSSLKRIFSHPLPKRRSRDDAQPRRHTVANPRDILGLSSSGRLGDSAPTILIRASASSIENKPIRSIMISRTLHESLHRGGRPRKSRSGSITFGQVNIREYERVLGDNPSVTSGPPLSIGWRYVPEPVQIDIDTFESGKGLPRSSSEYLVPKAVREKILREHADASRRDIATAVRNINRQKQQRRNTVVNIPMSSTQEKIEKVRRGVQKVMGSRSSYSKEEARLWDEAHAVAMEKARRLEESVRNGETLSMREVYKVGTPWNNVVPSVGNSLGGDEATSGVGETMRTESRPELQEDEGESSIGKQSAQLVSALYEPCSKEARKDQQPHKRRVSIGASTLDKSERLSSSKNRAKRYDGNFRHSDSDLANMTYGKNLTSGIVATENDDDVDDILAKLAMDECTKSGVS